MSTGCKSSHNGFLATVITARDELANPEENPDIKLKVFF